MKQQEHYKFALKQEKKAKDVIMNTFNIRLTHAAMGLVGEVIELEAYQSNENFIEEAGDVFFYDAVLRDVLGIPLLEDSGEVNIPSNFIIVEAAGDILDLCKKIIFYDQKPEDHIQKIWELSNKINVVIDEYLARIHSSHDEALQANIDKLKKRYPQGYTDQHAKERIDKL